MAFEPQVVNLRVLWLSVEGFGAASWQPTGVMTQGVELASNADGAMPGTTSRTKLLAAGAVDPKSTARRTVLGGPKRQDETKVSGGGGGHAKCSGAATSSTLTTPSRMTLSKPVINEMATSATSTSSPSLFLGELKTYNPGSESSDVASNKGSRDGGTGGDQAFKNEKAAELLHEATQSLKTLRMPPKINVMRLSELDRGRQNNVLIDSGATHAPRPARDLDEWIKSAETTVMLAEGSTNRFRLKPGSKILLSEPGQTPVWIVPMGGLAELDFVMQWSGSMSSTRA